MTTPDEIGTARTEVGPWGAHGGQPGQGASAGGYNQTGAPPRAATWTPSPTPRATPTPTPTPRATATTWASTAKRATTPGATAAWHDRVRWGAVWAGALVAFATFVVLQLLFFALGLLGLGYGGTSTGGIVAGILAGVAFFVGGLLAGASTMWRGAGDGVLHGVLVWALSLLVILILALIGSSALLGPLAELFGATQQQNIGFDPVPTLNSARQMAGWAALGLGVSVAAAALGGALGSKIWPGRKGPADLR